MTKSSYTGDGAKKSFDVGFPFLSETDLRVYIDGASQTLGSDYTVADVTAGSKAQVIFAADQTPDDGAVITIFRNTPIAIRPQNPVIGNIEATSVLYREQEEKASRVTLKALVSETDTLAGTAKVFEAPCDGYIEVLRTTVGKAVTTGGAVTVEVEGVAVTGLSVTIADSAAAGTVQEDVPTTPQSATTKVRRGQTITVTPAAAFATAGNFVAELEIQPADLD